MAQKQCVLDRMGCVNVLPTGDIRVWLDELLSTRRRAWGMAGGLGAVPSQRSVILEALDRGLAELLGEEDETQARPQPTEAP